MKSIIYRSFDEITVSPYMELHQRHVSPHLSVELSMMGVILVLRFVIDRYMCNDGDTWGNVSIYPGSESQRHNVQPSAVRIGCVATRAIYRRRCCSSMVACNALVQRASREKQCWKCIYSGWWTSHTWLEKLSGRIYSKYEICKTKISIV